MLLDRAQHYKKLYSTSTYRLDDSCTQGFVLINARHHKKALSKYLCKTRIVAASIPASVLLSTSLIGAAILEELYYPEHHLLTMRQANNTSNIITSRRDTC